ILRAPAYSASQVPAAMPSGAPMRMASPHMTALPYSALARPPSCIGGGVFCVNRARLMPPSPLLIVVHRSQARKNRPSSAAAQDRTMSMRLTILRFQYRYSATLALLSTMGVLTSDSLPTRQAHQHQARDGEHAEGDQEEHEAKQEQGRTIGVGGFREIVGDQGRDGRAGFEQRGREAHRIADDIGDRHGLAERATEPEEHA